MRSLTGRILKRGVLVLALGCLFASPVLAADDDVRRGVSMVSEIDAARGRMTVDDEVYRVNADTRITRADGTPASLSDIRVPKPKRNELLPETEWDHIRFQGERVRGRLYMKSIVILDGPVK